MLTSPIAQLQAILQNKVALYPAIIALDNQAISDLSQALEQVSDLCKTTVYVRTHWMEAQS